MRCRRPGLVALIEWRGKVDDSSPSILDALGLVFGYSHAACGRQTLLSTSGHPVFVLGDREALVDLVHGHQLLFPSTTMLSRVDRIHRDRIAIFVEAESRSIAGIVSEAVFDADDDPDHCQF